MKREHVDSILLFDKSSLLLHFNDGFNDSSENSIVPMQNDYQQSALVDGHFSRGVKIDTTSNKILRYEITDVVGTQDFTIDFWTYCSDYTAPSSFRWLFVFDRQNSIGTTESFSLRARNNGTLQFSTHTGSAWDEPMTNIALPKMKWSHIALSRKNGTLYLFIDGTLSYTYNFNYNIMTNNTKYLSIGSSVLNNVGTNRSYNGIIDEFRMVVGKAIWTSDFTPPSSQYTE